MISIFISIIIPGFNEEKRIQKTLHTLYSYCIQEFSHFEILFVDDGSTDQTRRIVNQISTDIRQIYYLGYTKNMGKGYAIRFGMRHAKGRYVFFTDADLPYDTQFFVHAVETFLQTDCEIISGNRHLDQSRNDAGVSQKRIWVSRIFSLIIRMLHRIEISDTQCGIKGFKKDCIRKLLQESRINGYAFDVEIFVLARLNQWDVELLPVVLVNNQFSKIRLGFDPLNILVDLIIIFQQYKKLFQKP